MAIRIKGKGMKFIMSGGKIGAIIVDGDGLELSFTPSAVSKLAAYFSECEALKKQGKAWR